MNKINNIFAILNNDLKNDVFILFNIDFNNIIYPIIGWQTFFIGICGMIVNRRNLVTVLAFLELLLLAINFNFIVFSYILDSIIGQIMALYVLTIAGSEVSIGLAILILVLELRV